MQPNRAFEKRGGKSKRALNTLIQAVKKIHDTRKRASDIVGQRRRNMEAQQQKLLRQQQLLAEQAEKTAMHQQMRDENANRVV